jgi:glycosyltransferase involved in cell wall biosynthesis
MYKPLVSVVVAAFNHEAYITQCLSGITNQKVNFDYEILVNDDCSTDKTAKIIKEFELKHPDKFRVIYQTENQYSKGIKPWFHILFPIAQGNYIALCEGDDYWTDPYKLQKQVDFLEANPDFIFVGGDTKVIDDKSNKVLFESFLDFKKKWIGIDIPKIINAGNVAEMLTPHTTTYVFRNIFKTQVDISVLNHGFASGDYALLMLLAKHGKMKVLSEVFSVYRKNEGGVTKIASAKGAKYSFDEDFRFLTYFNEWHNFKYSSAFLESIKRRALEYYFNSNWFDFYSYNKYVSYKNTLKTDSNSSRLTFIFERFRKKFPLRTILGLR